jgi:hypothetical protein
VVWKIAITTKPTAAARAGIPPVSGGLVRRLIIHSVRRRVVRASGGSQVCDHLGMGALALLWVRAAERDGRQIEV